MYIGYMVSTLFGMGEAHLKTPVELERIDLEDHEIIQFTINNQESRDLNCTVAFNINNKQRYNHSICVVSGRSYRGKYHVYPEENEKTNITFILYHEGELEPVKKKTWLIQDK
jgi:hypothetical protein